MNPLLRLAIKKEVPPDGFRFTHPEDGHVESGLSKQAWLKAVHKHREDNGYPALSDEQIIDQFCKLLPAGWCKYDDNTKPAWNVDTRIGVRDVLRGTKAFVAAASTGFAQVSKEEAEARAVTCSRCYFNVPVAGCSPCVGLGEMIANLRGKIETTADNALKSCAVCKCSNLAQTRMPAEVLKASLTDNQREAYRDTGFCWKREL